MLWETGWKGTVDIFIFPCGTEEPEFPEPGETVQNAKGTPGLLGAETGMEQTINSNLDPAGNYAVGKALYEVGAEDDRPHGMEHRIVRVTRIGQFCVS